MRGVSLVKVRGAAHWLLLEGGKQEIGVTGASFELNNLLRTELNVRMGENGQ